MTTFRTKNQGLADSAATTLQAEKPMTLRQLFYRLVSAGVIRNAPTEYKRLGAVMTRLREAGDVPRSWLVDHTRATLKPSSWSGLADYAETVRDCYRRDFWASLPHHVEVFVEKDAVAGTIQPVTEQYDIALRVCRGYSSISFAGEIADLWREIQKPIFAYYLGDFDPSGFDLERDLREKLGRYSALDIYAHDGGWFHGQDAAVIWQRLGVMKSDFTDHDLVRLPLKRNKAGALSDMRAAGFIRQQGSDCAEIDAIPPTELRRRVEHAIMEHVPAVEWNKLRAIEQTEQESLTNILGAMRAAG